MVLNANKYLFMCIGKDKENGTFIFNNFIFNNNNEERMLGITTDNKLTFKSHAEILYKKADQKIGAIESLMWFPEKINFQFHNKITI